MTFLPFFLFPLQIRNRLFRLAIGFVFAYALALTLSPAVRARSWEVELRWGHWLGVAFWGMAFILLLRQQQRYLPDADAYLLPLVALLSGWGILTIWRLSPGLGIRQSLWLLAASIVVSFGFRLAPELSFLRRYKYLLLSVGIALTALTFFFGANPAGDGLRLWLGCCGIYLQPSEPLKLLFVIYLSAYFAERAFFPLRWQSVIAPTLLVTSVALLLLIAQRDLGTASIFISLYTVMLYLASGRKRVLAISLAGLALAGISGYFLFDVIRLRVEAWLNPWNDPSGRSYQIVQSLIAIANGGVFGRGPGLGYPNLVPIATSDFIFTAIAEETGLTGSLALLGLLAWLTMRGFLIGLRAPDVFRRLLALGLTTYLAGQSILIIGGNLRLLPLTGVTLPFLSYGGSSLLTSFLAILLLLLISGQADEEPVPLPRPQPVFLVAALLGLGLLALAVLDGWWVFGRGLTLLNRTDNPRRAIAERYVRRGALLDRGGTPINRSQGQPGSFVRCYCYPNLSSVIGYTHSNFGQTGLEASLDPFLRGLQGNPASLIWFYRLLYGQPPPGLDVRLSLDLKLQKQADQLLGAHTGAVVLLNAETGEILVMASHPTYDANRLDELHDNLLKAPDYPLVNRAAQWRYPTGDILSPFWKAAASSEHGPRLMPDTLYEQLGFFTPPQVRLPVAAAVSAGEPVELSPLQLALGTAALSNQGIRPAARLALAVNTPAEGWVILPPQDKPQAVFSAAQVAQAVEQYALPDLPFWQWTSQTQKGAQTFTWSIGGTLPTWKGVPLAVVVLLEEKAPTLAEYLGREMLKSAIAP